MEAGYSRMSTVCEGSRWRVEVEGQETLELRSSAFRPYILLDFVSKIQTPPACRIVLDDALSVGVMLGPNPVEGTRVAVASQCDIPIDSCILRERLLSSLDSTCEAAAMGAIVSGANTTRG